MHEWVTVVDGYACGYRTAERAFAALAQALLDVSADDLLSSLLASPVGL